MIRTITAQDAPTIVDLAVAADLFPAEESGIVAQMMTDYFTAAAADGHACLVDEHDGRLVGVAYYEPLPATDRTWELTMIGVDRDHHRQGRGTRLLHAVENDLRTRHQRLLLIQTSALPAFDRARAFYRTCGYDEEARVRDYYETGDDMIMFRKALTPPVTR
ncbi:GNAT family N-acetyltransferase [Micromonospora endolithica]|uniref:GNAT family N-acetyltransferase n=1 Tax=Micromonospora endolithica TaxID=230091 RepID=A0A3A9YQ58_9ACTN|nr:GNAT family N-acetyltransferase [Micromonospora endolithica]RKN38241.1 GNAT family N-acetyltransferase [Micromonospora endolithica]TWJ25208.1 ribosomal protein S18 acetylase RimI-like enzyme [Micromonospora endolithica]